MAEVTWMDNYVPFLLRTEIIPKDVKTVLDVGCGHGVVGNILHSTRNLERLVGIDIWEPALDACRSGCYTELHRMDITKRPLDFKEGEFDLALCLEVIEHIERMPAFVLMNDLRKMAKTVIVSTPLKYYPQGAFDKNEAQKHVSYYPLEDFKTLRFDDIYFYHQCSIGEGKNFTVAGIFTASKCLSDLVSAVLDKRYSSLIAVRRGRSMEGIKDSTA